MKKRIIFITLWVVSVIALFFSVKECQSQAVNETFSTFLLPSGVDSVEACYYMNSAFSHRDTSANTNHLTLINFEADFDTSLVTSSPINDGGKALQFTATSNQGLTATSDDFRIRTNDYTLEFWIYPYTIVTESYLIWQGYGQNTANPGYRLKIETDLDVFVSTSSNANVFYNAVHTGTKRQFVENVWQHYELSWDRDGNLQGYFDGISANTNPVNISAFVADTVTNAVAMVLAQRTGELVSFDGMLASVRFMNRLKTAKERAEDIFLATGWYSKAGKVTRESNTTFHQGFYDSDTVYYPVTNLGGNYTLFVDAKGTKNGDVLTAWLGNGTVATQTLTASSETYSLSLTDNTSATDSLWFSASASDTVYIDNVLLMSSGYEKRFPRFPDSPKDPRH
jgi:hypothetical protein